MQDLDEPFVYDTTVVMTVNLRKKMTGRERSRRGGKMMMRRKTPRVLPPLEEGEARSKEAGAPPLLQCFVKQRR